MKIESKLLIISFQIEILVDCNHFNAWLCRHVTDSHNIIVSKTRLLENEARSRARTQERERERERERESLLSDSLDLRICVVVGEEIPQILSVPPVDHIDDESAEVGD